MDRSADSRKTNNRESKNLPNYHRQLVSRLDRGTPNQRTDQGKGKEPIRDASTEKLSINDNIVNHGNLIFTRVINVFTEEIMDISIAEKATSGAAKSVPEIIELSDCDDEDHPRMKRGGSSQRLFEKANPTVLGSVQEENDKPNEPKSILKKLTESPKPKEDQSKQVRFADSEMNTFQIASQQEELLGKRKRQQNDQFPQITKKKSNKLREIRKEINSRQNLYKVLQEQTKALNQDIRDVIDILSKRFKSFRENPLGTNSSESIYKHNEILDPNKQLNSQNKNISNDALIEYLKYNKDKALDKQEPNYVYHGMIDRLVDRYDKLSKNIKFNEQKLQKLAKDEEDLLIEYNDTRHFGQPTSEAGKSVLEIIELSDSDDETHPTLKEGMKRGESSQQKELLGKRKMQQDDQFPQITETQIREMENERQKLWEAGQLDQTFHQNLRQALQIREMKLNREIQQRIPKEFSSIFDYFKENPHKINDLESIPEYKDLFDRKEQLSKQHEETFNMIKFAKEYRFIQVNQTVINHLENKLSQIQKAINEHVKKINYYRIINKLANKQYIQQKEIEDNEQKLKETNEEFREYTPYFDILHSDIDNNERT